MIEVELPDGSIAEFPDGTSNDVIKGALQKRFAPPSKPVEFAGGMTGAGALGAADTLSAGFGDELGAGLGAASEYIASLITGEKPRSYNELLAAMRDQDARAKETNPGSYLTGQIAGGVGQAAALGPLSLGARGSTLGRVAAGSAVDGAVLGGAYGLGSGDTADERLTGLRDGVIAGGATGAIAPVVVSGATNLFRRAVSPFAIPAERQAAISTLQAEGVPLTAGQRTGNKALQYSESEIGGARATDLMDNQGRAFTRAAMRRAGQDTLADPDSMAALNQRLSQGFEDISARNTLRADGQFLGDLVGTLREYGGVLPSEQSRILGNIATDIGDRVRAGGGAISGDDYQTIRSRLSKRSRNARGSDNELADAYAGLRNALDSAMDRSIRPEDAGAWQELRRQWKNKRTLENAIGGASGENAGMGIISPSRLRTAASSGKARGSYARGEGDFADLARAGQTAMTPLPNSGTASRLSARSLGMMAPAILGAGYGGATGGDMQSALLGAGAGYALQKGAGAALMSRPVQNYLSNQAMSGPVDDELRSALARLIMGGSVPQAQEALPWR